MNMAQLFNRSSVYFLVRFFHCKFGWNFKRKAKLNGFGQRNICGCFAGDSIIMILFWFIRRKKKCVYEYSQPECDAGEVCIAHNLKHIILNAKEKY